MLSMTTVDPQDDGLAGLQPAIVVPPEQRDHTGQPALSGLVWPDLDPLDPQAQFRGCAVLCRLAVVRREHQSGVDMRLGGGSGCSGSPW